MDLKFRCEADHYGYAHWLARHLGYEFNPLSLRGFQHGWIWWKPEDCPYELGLDPNLNHYFGVLTQDNDVEQFLTKKGIYAKACGLPFLNFYHHFDFRDAYVSKRGGKVLFVPTHSNPWNNYSKAILDSIYAFKKKFGEVSVLLGAEDYAIFQDLGDDQVHLLKGAGVTDISSFYRLAKYFESHEYVITDCIGSHVCYALHCGAKVGIDRGLFENARKTMLATASPDNSRLSQHPDRDDFFRVGSIEYIESRFPTITIDDSLPTYNTPPSIAYEKPHIIASELGWNLTYPCEQIK